MWGAFPDKAVILKIKPELAGEYTITQINDPVLAFYADKDNRIEEVQDEDYLYIKTQTVTLTEDDELEVLVTDNSDDIVITFYEGNAVDAAKVAKTYKIVSGVTFA